MVFNATFNNISVISRRSVLLVEDNNVYQQQIIYNVSKNVRLGWDYEWKCILPHLREKRIYIG